jgi:hypothetical protein
MKTTTLAPLPSLLPRDRRRGPDRRRVRLRTFLQGALTPRRRGNRRHDESDQLVDWHEPQLLLLALLILLLSVADAFMTLRLIMGGAVEANPFMNYLLFTGPHWFAAVKMSLTGMGVIVLVAIARARVFRVIKVSSLLHYCLLGYVALIAYEWWLLGKLAT